MDDDNRNELKRTAYSTVYSDDIVKMRMRKWNETKQKEIIKHLQLTHTLRTWFVLFFLFCFFVILLFTRNLLEFHFLISVFFSVSFLFSAYNMDDFSTALFILFYFFFVLEKSSFTVFILFVGICNASYCFMHNNYWGLSFMFNFN